MISKSISFLATGIMFLAGCQTPSENTVTYLDQVTVSSGEIKTPNRLTDILEPVAYINISGEGEDFVAGIDKIALLGDDFVLLDRVKGQVIGVDKSGNRKFTYKSSGEGPGEFRHLIDLAVDSKRKRIFVLDQYKIICFSDSGEFIHEIPLTEGGMAFAYDGNDEVFHMLLGRGHPMLLGRISAEGNLTGEFITKDNLNRMLNRETLFEDGESVFLNLYLNDTIYSLGPDGPGPYTFLDFDRKLTKGQYEELDNQFSIDKIIEVLPRTMSNVNFFRRIPGGHFAVFHYQQNMHWLVTTQENGKKVRAFPFNVGNSFNDLSFEERLPVPMAVDGWGNLVFVLNTEELTSKSLEKFDPLHPMAKAFKESLNSKEPLPGNPIIMLAALRVGEN